MINFDTEMTWVIRRKRNKLFETKDSIFSVFIVLQSAFMYFRPGVTLFLVIIIYNLTALVR